MENTVSDFLVVLLSRISVRNLIESSVSSSRMRESDLEKIFLPYMTNYSDTEMRHLLSAVKDWLKGYTEFDDVMHGLDREINVFNAVFHFADKMLVEQDNEIACRYTRLLRWRQVVSKISEETFVMAFMAKKDIKNIQESRCFSHKPVIGHNNAQLKAVLNGGMSENHFHLMGSAPYFHMSWIQLMNHISGNSVMEKLRRFEERRRNVNIKYSRDYMEEPFDIRICQAFLIRLYLFSRLANIRIEIIPYRISVSNLELEFGVKQDAYIWTKEALEEKGLEETKAYSIREILSMLFGDEDANVDGMEAFARKHGKICRLLEHMDNVRIPYSDFIGESGRLELLQLLRVCLQAQKSIALNACRDFLDEETFDALWERETLQCVQKYLSDAQGLRLLIPDLQRIVNAIKNMRQLCEGDYALILSHYEWYENEGRYLDLWGERAFLYHCFRKICKHGVLFSEYASNLFHAYLVLKETVRGEMVQANEYVGFENFQIYERRKKVFLGSSEFGKRMARMAVRDTLQSQNIVSLEARITPAARAEDNYKMICSYDEAIDNGGELRDRFYYVFHFIKSKESVSSKTLLWKPRQFQKRRNVEICAQAVRTFRERYPVAASRVLGIDAASQEIGCRPEVFATAFRLLRSHTCSYGVTREKRRLPQLRISYHVGEDFLDILDGLRAIAEAILFLKMDCGDRLGHALALGIEVDEWYALKNYHVSIPAQDYLDNIAWLYHAIVQYHIQGMDNLKSYLQKEFTFHFSKIYGDFAVQNKIAPILAHVKERYAGQEAYKGYFAEESFLSYNIFTYYSAWMLRGDEPEMYKKGFFCKREGYEDYQNTHAVNSLFPEDYSIRYIPEVAYLNYLYQYAAEVKKRGEREVDYKVMPLFVKGVAQVQKELQKEIAQRGIAIETNPTSNYMIGTFKKYAKHPIVQFYNRGLVAEDCRLRECPQISASINTDDQGVFSASLENEYALMASALERKTDENGECLYNKMMIYEWLNNIRMNGNRQAFGLLNGDLKKYWKENAKTTPYIE